MIEGAGWGGRQGMTTRLLFPRSSDLSGNLGSGHLPLRPLLPPRLWALAVRLEWTPGSRTCSRHYSFAHSCRGGHLPRFSVLCLCSSFSEAAGRQDANCRGVGGGGGKYFLTFRSLLLREGVQWMRSGVSDRSDTWRPRSSWPTFLYHLI